MEGGRGGALALLPIKTPFYSVFSPSPAYTPNLCFQDKNNTDISAFERTRQNEGKGEGLWGEERGRGEGKQGWEERRIE